MISVIIPIYNTGKLLNRMLQSIQKQSYKDLEIILINDGSTDESEQECKKAEINDERIRYFYQENAGVSSARNYGMKLAQGEYIAFLDSDDEIDTNYFEQLLIACKNTDIAVCNLIVESNNKEELSRFEMNNQILTSTEALNQLLTRKGINSGPCAKLFRKKIIEDLYFPDLKVYEDILFVKDAFKKAKKVSVINSVAYHYYQNEGGAMHAGENTPSLDIINVTEQLLKFEDKNKQLSPECIYITFSHLYQYVQLLRDNDSEKSRVFIKEAQKIFYKNYKMMINCKFFSKKEIIIYTLFRWGWVYSDGGFWKVRRWNE